MIKQHFLLAYLDGCDTKANALYMTTHTKLNNKQILSNPVSAYILLHPGASDENTSRVETLVQIAQDLKSQHKKALNECKATSRAIGQAKRESRPIDDLKTTMQAQSKILESLKIKINEAETEILTFFNDEPEISKQKNTTTTSETSRAYRNSSNDAGAVSISLLGENHRDWNDYVNNNPAASIYHRAEWKKLIQQTHNHKGLYYIACNAEQKIVGILPLIHLKSKLFGNFMVSVPYFNYGGAIADHPVIEQKLITSANDHARKLGISHIEYRDDVQRKDLPVRTDKVNMILELPSKIDTLWTNFTPKLRSQIKRPQREHPTTVFGKEELLNDFYEVFVRNMRDLGTPVYKKTFFRNILKTFPETSHIVTVRMDNRPVAAGFLLGHKNTLEIPWASTIKNVNHLSVNMLMYWEVLQFAIKNQYSYFDFGRSSKESGTFRFKQQWGAKPKQLFWHYWLAENIELPKLNPDNPKYALAINLWKRLPITLTKWLGPHIVKNLP